MIDQGFKTLQSNLQMNCGYFPTAKAAREFIETHKEKGAVFQTKALPNSFGYEVFKTLIVRP